MNPARSDSKPSSRFNGALCTTCQRQFQAGEAVMCPDDQTLLVPCVIDPLIGSIIDKKYRLLALSGKGATGRVYRAWHESIKRPVALKIADAPVDSASAKTVERMRREAKALSIANHPNLPRLFDGGELDDGSAYLVIDFFDGCSLLDMITAKKRLSPEQLVALISQICDALDHIHAHGITHRDVKPENIIVLNRPEGRTIVKLIDFGICKFEELIPSEDSLSTSIELCGSPLYMSPENVNSALVDKRSDIYSLGATMYHALAGVPPLSETTLIDIIHAHRSVMPAPIGYVSPGADVPAALEAAVFRALQKLPGNRFQTAAEMKQALTKAMSHDTFTGKLMNLQFSGAELRALLAFVKASSVEQVQRLLSQDADTASCMKTSLLSKLRLAIHSVEEKQAPTGESLEEVALEHTIQGPG